MAYGWEPKAGAFPIAPQNLVATSPYIRGVVDLRWDAPNALSKNGSWQIIGVNIYRCDSSDRGPFFRLNDSPIQSTFYRDRTDISWRQEVIGPDQWLYRGDAPNSARWSFRTKHTIIKAKGFAPRQEPAFSNSPYDVKVYVDGVEVAVSSVLGRSGEVVLANTPELDPSLNSLVSLPDIEASQSVECHYYSPSNFVTSGLDKWVHYRVTTVAIDPEDPSILVETPFGYSEPTSLHEVEKLDYIWREGVRRNAWILQQGGERVKLFVKKVCGIHCDCKLSPQKREYQKQPNSRCEVCFATGWVGGYEGPFDVIIAPDDSERRLSRDKYGTSKTHTYEVWTGPSPLLTQRDFLVKESNERYSIGPVRRPSNRGNVLQQHFTIGYLNEGDIRYLLPIDGEVTQPAIASRVDMPRLPVDGGPSVEQAEGWGGEAPFPEGPFEVTPGLTDKATTPDNVETRGRTRVWENINS